MTNYHKYYEGYRRLERAAREGDIMTLEKLSPTVPLLVQTSSKKYEHISTSFDYAVLAGQLAVVKWLKEHRPGEMTYRVHRWVQSVEDPYLREDIKTLLTN